MKNYVDVAVSKELRKKYDIRSIPICKGDIVKIRNGKLKGEGGKVINVNHSRELISIEGVTSSKTDGKQKERRIKPQKLIITKIDFTRQERLDRIREVARMKNFTIVEPTPEELSPEPEEKVQEQVESGTAETVVETEESTQIPPKGEGEVELPETEEEPKLPEAEEDEMSVPEEGPEEGDLKPEGALESPQDDTESTKKSSPRPRKKTVKKEDSDIEDDSGSKKGGRKKNDKQD